MLLEVRGVTELQFSDGQRVVIQRLRPDFVFEAWVPPGHRGRPAHRHRWETETFTVHEGRLLVRSGRSRVELGPGDSVVVPTGATHSFSDPYDQPARIRTVGSAAGPLHAQLRALASSDGAVPPLLELAEMNAAHDWSFTLAGVPDRPQRLLWRALAAGAARSRR